MCFTLIVFLIYDYFTKLDWPIAFTDNSEHNFRVSHKDHLIVDQFGMIVKYLDRYHIVISSKYRQGNIYSLIVDLTWWGLCDVFSTTWPESSWAKSLWAELSGANSHQSHSSFTRSSRVSHARYTDTPSQAVRSSLRVRHTLLLHHSPFRYRSVLVERPLVVVWRSLRCQGAVRTAFLWTERIHW